jgi:uncharacterized phage-like protein YoqJ
MLTIENISNIENREFQMSSGQKYVIGIVRTAYDHYSFGVFPLKENGVASIKDVIVYRLMRTIKNSRGYHLTNSLGPNIAFVPKQNLTLKNFILELHIQTGLLNAYNRK